MADACEALHQQLVVVCDFHQLGGAVAVVGALIGLGLQANWKFEWLQTSRSPHLESQLAGVLVPAVNLAFTPAALAMSMGETAAVELL